MVIGGKLVVITGSASNGTSQAERLNVNVPVPAQSVVVITSKDERGWVVGAHQFNSTIRIAVEMIGQVNLAGTTVLHNATLECAEEHLAVRVRQPL